jgi:hypothetical protein
MSEQNGGTPAPGEDRLANLQAEFARKQDNIKTELGGELAAIKQQLAEAVSRLPKAPEPKVEDDSELLYSNPAAYKQKLESSVLNRVNETVSRTLEERSRAESERLQTLSALAADYPELNKADTGLYQETIKILNSMPAEKRGTAEAYKLAVWQAAAQEGIRPASKRGNSDAGDTFSFSGRSSNTSGKKKSAADDIDPKSIAWMQLLDPSFDANDEKQVEEFKKYTKRDFRSPQ